MLLARRPVLLVLLAGVVCVACGSGTTLRTVSPAKGKGAIELSVFNGSGEAINALFIAETERVRKAKGKRYESGSKDERVLWGDDMLRSAIQEEQTLEIPGIEPGRYDVRVLDKNGREQHIAGLKLGAGGKYVLELGSSGWRFIQ